MQLKLCKVQEHHLCGQSTGYLFKATMIIKIYVDKVVILNVPEIQDDNILLLASCS